MARQSDKNLIIACLTLFCLAISSSIDVANGAPAPVAAAAANLLKRSGSSVFNMAQDLSKQTEAERGGSMKKALSTKLSDKALDKGLSLLTKHPAFAATAPLLASLKPVVSAKVGEIVDNFGKKPKEATETTEKKSKKSSKEDANSDNEVEGSENESVEDAWNKINPKSTKKNDESSDDKTKTDEEEEVEAERDEVTEEKDEKVEKVEKDEKEEKKEKEGKKEGEVEEEEAPEEDEPAPKNKKNKTN